MGKRKQYDNVVRTRCKRKWLQGKSVRAIAREENVSADAIYEWRKKYNWDESLKKLEAKTEERTLTQLAEELSEIDKKQLEALNIAMEHILNLLNNSELSSKEIELLLRSVLYVGRSNKQIRGDEKPTDVSMTNILFHLKEKAKEYE